MDGANLELHHETIEQATAEMQRAVSTMHDNLQALITGLTAMRETFQGVAADAFNNFLHTAHDADTRMTEEFSRGHQLLTRMHENIRNADVQGARGYLQ